MHVLNKLTNFVLTYPVACATVFRSAILCGVAFGAKLSADQIASVMLVIESVLGAATHQSVTPMIKVNNANPQ